jgi:conjugative transfer region protein TrbK
MSRSAKIAGVAVIAGLMMTVAIVSVTSKPELPSVKAELGEGDFGDGLASELERCRIVAMPDAGCAAAWEAHRRRFLGQDQIIEVPADPDTFVSDAQAQGNGADPDGNLPSPSLEVPAP